MSTQKELPDASAAMSGQEVGTPRNLIGSAAYGPENLKRICQAFDQAWEAIKPIVDNNPLAHEAARLKLANTILSVASGDMLVGGRLAQTVSSGPGEPGDSA